MSHPPRFRSALLVLAFSLLAGPSWSQGVRLNGPLLTSSDGGDVTSVTASPDGSLVSFLAQVTGNEAPNLFVAPADGSSPAVSLQSGFGNAGPLGFHRISPDLAWVVYNHKGGLGAATQYRSRRADGSGSIVELTNLPFGGFASGLQISPDSSRVVYRVRTSSGGPTALVSAPIGGGLGNTLSLGVEFAVFEITPDSSHVVFAAGADPVVYSSPIGGGGALQLGPSLPAGRSVSDLRLNAAGDRVVYRADQDLDDVDELYSVPVDGSAPAIKVHQPLVAGQTVFEYVVSPVDDRVLFLSDRDGPVELYIAPLDGSQPETKLNGALVAGGDVTSTFGFDPTGTWVGYVADQDIDGVSELFSVRSDASTAPLKLTLPFPMGGKISRLLLTATHAVYLADQAVDGVREVYSAPLDGSATSQRLNAPLAADRTVQSIRLSPDGARVVYRADQTDDEVFELFSAPVDGSAPPVRVSGALVPGGDVSSSNWLVLAGDRVVYVADQEEDETQQIYSVLDDGAGASVVVGPELYPVQVIGDVGDFAVPSRGRHVVFFAREQNPTELFSVSTDAPGITTPLNGPLFGLNAAAQLALTPDAQRVVFTSDEIAGDGLFSAPVDGSATRVRLSDPLPSGANVFSFLISADSQYVTYHADQNVVGLRELFSAPTDGSSPPMPLAAGFVATTPVELSPDGTRLLFEGIPSGASITDLYTVPVDGSLPPVALTTVAAGETLKQSAFNGDSQRVIFRLEDAAARHGRPQWCSRAPRTPAPAHRRSRPHHLP